MSDSSHYPGAPVVTPEQIRMLAIVRFAQLFAPLALGAVVFMKHRQTGLPATDPGAFHPIALAAGLLAVLGLAAALLLRPRLRRATSFPQYLSTTALGLAVSEGAALLGGIYYFLYGRPHLYGIGMAVLIATLMLLPADPRRID